MARPRGIGADIVTLRLKGRTYNQIAQELDCSKGTVQYHCEKQGLSDIGYNKGKISEKVQSQIYNDYKEGMEIKDVAKKYMVHRATVHRYINKFEKQKPDSTIV